MVPKAILSGTETPTIVICMYRVVLDSQRTMGPLDFVCGLWATPLAMHEAMDAIEPGTVQYIWVCSSITTDEMAKERLRLQCYLHVRTYSTGHLFVFNRNGGKMIPKEL